MVYWVSSLAQTSQNIEKRVSASLKGVKIKVFPVKKLTFILFIFILKFPNLQFLPNFQNIMFNHFYWCLASVISMVHSDLFIFNNAICIILKVPSIRIHLSIGSLKAKIAFRRVTAYCLSNFPFVNLQIKSIFESLRSIKLCTQ